MKSKKTIFIAIALITITLLSTQVFALQKKESKVRLGVNASTTAEKESIERVENRLNDAWDDIKYTFNLDDTNYTMLNFTTDLADFSQGNYPGFTDKKLINESSEVIYKLYSNPAKGSTIPVILINSKMDNIILCYKEQDGTNVMKQAIKKDNQWEMTESRKSGKPILEIKK